MRKDKKQNEIKRGELPHLPLSGDAEKSQKEGIDDYTPHN
jgi:hypothetical protein